MSKSANFSFPKSNKGSITFILRMAGSIRAKGYPFTLIVPLPLVHVAMAIDVFFFPNVYTVSLSVIF